MEPEESGVRSLAATMRELKRSLDRLSDLIEAISAMDWPEDDDWGDDGDSE